MVDNTTRNETWPKKAGLVIGQRDGKQVRYRLQDGPIVETLEAFRRLAEHNVAAIGDIKRRYFEDIDCLAPVSRSELFDRLADDSVVVLDVRPEDEFGFGHVPGAKHIAIEDLERRIAELPHDREVIAYCRGPYCIMSYQAVELLRSKGYSARRLQDGLPEWRVAGLPIETA